MSDKLFGSGLAAFLLLGFSSVLSGYFFIQTTLFFPVLALVTSGRIYLPVLASLPTLLGISPYFLLFAPLWAPRTERTFVCWFSLSTQCLYKWFNSPVAGEETSSPSFPF